MENMTLFDQETLRRFSRHVTVAHHVPGRVRFKFNPTIVKEVGEEAINEMKTFDKRLKGIREVKLNKLARSVTITYDKSVLEPAFFEGLAAGTVPADLADLIIQP